MVGKVQSAFTKGRNIQDSILIANEILDGWKRNDSKGLVIKLDFEKAFDNLNWNFLFKMMQQMGYPHKWIGWIRECLSTAWISVLVNGAPTKQFKTHKGIRQGDPLSPFLFIIAAEGLNRLFLEAIEQGKLKGMSVVEGGPIITHLQFADDTIIFCNASMEEVEIIKILLKGFEVMSGLRINFHKSLVCGVGINQDQLSIFAKALRCHPQKLPIKYLGMPLGASPRLKSTWKPVIDKIKSRLSSWKRRNTSFGGRLTQIKSVLSNLPIYYMSIFKIPEGVAKTIESIQANFLWGGSDLNRKIHMFSWAKMMQKKEHGGLGIKGVREMNEALLLKWWWRYGVEKDALWRKLICSKYKGGNWLPFMEMNRKVSIIWRDILLVQNRRPQQFSNFLDNIRFKIGDGSAISFWQDAWVEGNELSVLFPRLFRTVLKKEESIADILIRRNEQSAWDFQLRRRLFDWEITDLQVLTNLLDNQNLNVHLGTSDQLVWKATNTNSFSVQSMYRILLYGDAVPYASDSKVFKLIWNNAAPYRSNVLGGWLS